MKELPNGMRKAHCQKCGVILLDSGWCPYCGDPSKTEDDTSGETKRVRNTGSRGLDPVARLLVAFVLWVGLGLLTMLSAIPYGGGNKLMAGIWQMVTLALLVWVILGFIRERKDSNG